MTVRFDAQTTIDLQLRQRMLRLRKRVFCDALGWDIPHWDGMEADVFDFNESFYLNILDSHTGSLRASVRLMPLMRDNLMTTVFKSSLPQDSAADLRASARVWEGTRLCFGEDVIEPKARASALVELLCALFRAAQAVGIDKLLCNCDSFMYRRYRGMGLKIQHLGATKAFRHGAVHTLAFEIDATNFEVLHALAAQADVEWPCIEGDGLRRALAITLDSAPAEGDEIKIPDPAFAPLRRHPGRMGLDA